METSKSYKLVSSHSDSGLSPSNSSTIITLSLQCPVMNSLEPLCGGFIIIIIIINFNGVTARAPSLGRKEAGVRELWALKWVGAGLSGLYDAGLRGTPFMLIVSPGPLGSMTLGWGGRPLCSESASAFSRLYNTGLRGTPHVLRVCIQHH